MESVIVGGNKSALWRVLMEWTSKLCLNSFIFLTTNNNNEVFIKGKGGGYDLTAEVWDQDPAQHVWRCSRSMYFRVITVGRAPHKDYTILDDGMCIGKINCSQVFRRDYGSQCPS